MPISARKSCSTRTACRKAGDRVRELTLPSLARPNHVSKNVFQVQRWSCCDHDGGWIVERVPPNVVGTPRNDHGFPCLRHPGLATRDNLYPAFGNLEPFLGPRVDMRPRQCAAGPHLEPHLQETTAGRCGGLDKGQALAAERVIDCLAYVCHSSPPTHDLRESRVDQSPKRKHPRPGPGGFAQFGSVMVSVAVSVAVVYRLLRLLDNCGLGVAVSPVLLSTSLFQGSGGGRLGR
jgi:hypothetical protein